MSANTLNIVMDDGEAWQKSSNTQTTVLTWIKINSWNVCYISWQIDVVSSAIFKEIWLLLSAIATLSDTASSDQGLSFSSYISLRGLTLSHTLISPGYESDRWQMKNSMRGFLEIDFETNSSKQLQISSQTFTPTLPPAKKKKYRKRKIGI